LILVFVVVVVVATATAELLCCEVLRILLGVVCILPFTYPCRYPFLTAARYQCIWSQRLLDTDLAPFKPVCRNEIPEARRKC